MSWDIHVSNVQPAAFRAQAARAQRDYLDRVGTAPAEVLEQQELAASAAALLVEGVGSGAVSVTMSGHANPGHETRDGLAPDTIMVTVAQARQSGLGR